MGGVELPRELGGHPPRPVERPLEGDLLDLPDDRWVWFDDARDGLVVIRAAGHPRVAQRLPEAHLFVLQHQLDGRHLLLPPPSTIAFFRESLAIVSSPMSFF